MSKIKDAEQLRVLEMADKLINIARHHFPKSIHNPDTFQLNLTGAAIRQAIVKATGKGAQ